MNSKEAAELLERYYLGYCTAEEISVIEDWFESLPADDRVMTDAEKSRLSAQLKQVIDLKTGHDGVNKKIKLWPRIVAVSMAWKIAAAVTAISLGVWFYYASGLFGGRHPEFSSGSPLANDIAPGKNRATLTLANGEIINLSDAKTGIVIGNDLTYNDGSTVASLSPSGRDGVAREGNNSGNPLSPQGGFNSDGSKSSSVSLSSRGSVLPGGERSRAQMLTASTPRGGTYQVTLPDGTRVWLNADSKISFPSQFSGKERKILLSGEAYFEVAKVVHLSPSGRDGRRPERVPFIVESKGQQVEVLGTHFNISNYPNEPTKTTLLEGSVRVTFGSPSASRSSLPRGEMASAREGSKNNNNPLSPQGGSLPEGERSIVLKPNEQSTLARAGKIAVKQVNSNEAIAWKDGYFRFDDENITSIMAKLSRWYNIEVEFESSPSLEGFNGKISRFKNISQVLKMLEETNAVHFKVQGQKVTVSK